MGIQITGLTGLPEIRSGDDLGRLILAAAREGGHAVDSRTIVVVAQKIVSKAEGAVIDLATLSPSALARAWAASWNKDPRLIELILTQSKRVVKMDRGVLIAETHHGFIAANAGIDQSNVPGEDRAALLPADPDRSARDLRQALGCGAVIISDTFGRPWREGLVNVAIGVAGIEPLEDLRGTRDRDGRPLSATILALADELAAAAGLAMKKAAGVPVVLIHGVDWTSGEGSARALIRPAERDLFR
ncbi:MAG TPA: coenzyme F420-0:L-glutamate ligase [Bryobacteraceae bacterium]|nr:coenzyme F420-0:L-glutamate ligase [Bryobacteraceae bacterium]